MLSGNTYSPTDANDDGTAGTLRAAIASANADAGTQADTIQLASGTYLLTFGELEITNTAHTLIIDGQGSTGPNATIIDQLSLDRVFQIAAGAAVTFENVEITGGVAGDDDTGSSTVDAQGGGILSDGNLTLDQVSVTGNKALATVGSEGAQGGGVYATGSLTILDGSLIEGNSASAAPGTLLGGGDFAYGGGIFSRSASLVNISGSTIANNAVLGGTSASGDDGGEAIGGGVYLSNSGTSATVLDDDTITGNQAIGGTGGAGATGGLTWGGGVAGDLGGGNSPLLITDSTISDNIVKAGAGGSGGVGGDAYGGAVVIFTGGSQLSNDTVSGNSTTGGAGTTGGGAFAGGILDDTGVDSVSGLSIENVTVVANVAQGGAPTAGGSAGIANGGGMDNDSGDASLVVENALFAENTAEFGPDVYGAAATTDHNLIGVYDGTVASGFNAAHGDQLGTSGSPINPLVGPLQNNGGNTQTIGLLAGSPAIDAGDNTAAAGLSTDQRGTGFARVAGTAVDVGAYEVQASLATTTTLSPITGPINVGQSVTFTATIGTASGTPTGTVTFEDTLSGVTTNLGTGTVAGGVATFTALSLPAGSNSVTAVYSGDTTFNGSSSASQAVVVNLASGTAYAPVATAADGTAGSLRAAVALANAAAGASTIVLSSGFYSLTQGQLHYTNTAGTLTILGQGSTGPNATIIDQLSLDRVLNVATGTTVVLENVELTGGLADTDQGGGTAEADGGGALVSGNLALSNCGVVGNRAIALAATNSAGAGIYVTSTGSLTITGTTPGASLIDNNSSIAAAASGSGNSGFDAYAGGLISNGTSLQVTGTTVADNAALGGAGANGASGVAGGNGGFSVVGGLYSITSGAATAVLTDDTIMNNIGQGGAGGIGGAGAAGGAGGDVFTGGLAIDNDGSTPAVLSGTTISGNMMLGGSGGVGGAGAAGGVGGDVHGGGAYFFNDSTSATPVLFQGNTFSGNTATGGAGGAGAIGGHGGAASGGAAFIDIEGASSTQSQSETISGNTVQGGAGGSGAVGGSNGPGGIASGGGFYVSNITTSTTSLTQDTFTGNQALGATGATTNNGDAAYGGGLVSNGTGSIQITNTTVSNNSSLGGAGSAGVTGVNGDDGTAGDGDSGGTGIAGGVYIYSSGTTAPTLTGDTITNNTAQGGAGGAGASGSNAGNGGSVFGGGFLSEGADAANLSDLLIADNTATGGAGGAAGIGGTSGSGGSAAGGGLLTSTAGTKLLNSTLFGNTVTGGSGFNAGNAYGGGIDDETGFRSPSGVSIVNVTVASNLAQAGTAAGGASGTAYGGGISNDSNDASLVVDNTLVANNQAETSSATAIEADGPDFYGQATTAWNNLIGDGSGIISGFSGNGNQLGPSAGVVPGLAGSLANLGGPTETLTLEADSTARGAGSVAVANAFGLTTDQRGTGFSRIVNGAVDIGAYETEPPVVTPAGTTNTFTVGGTAVAIDAGVAVSSSDTDLSGATVTLSAGTLEAGDTLHFANQNGISGNYASGTLTLSGSATPAQYQTALESITFSSTSASTTARSISIVAIDGSLDSNSAPETVDIDLPAPVVTANQTSVSVTAGATVVADSAVTVSSFDTDVTGATVTIGTGLTANDVLHFTNQNGISIASNTGGVLTLTGSATPAQYQAALASVTFSNPVNSSTATRNISIVVSDSGDTGNVDSNTATTQIAVAAPVTVTGAWVANPAWGSSGTTNFFGYLASHGLGSATLGYALQTGANQLIDLPFANINTISVQFSGAVSNVGLGSLQLVGGTGGGSTGAATATPSVTGFASDGNNTYSWTLSGNLTNNKYVFAIATTGSSFGTPVSTQVTDSNGAGISGTFTTGSSTFANDGNGLAGSTFDFFFNVLPGDGNQNGLDNSSDTAEAKTLANDHENAAAYNPYFDYNGTGLINTIDSALDGTYSNDKQSGITSPSAPAASQQAGGVAGAGFTALALSVQEMGSTQSSTATTVSNVVSAATTPAATTATSTNSSSSTGTGSTGSLARVASSAAVASQTAQILAIDAAIADFELADLLA
jgi:ribosomal protein S11